MSAQRAADVDRYWRCLFPRAWGRVLERMATCDGLFPLECRELSPRWTRSSGESIMKRHQTYTDVVAECQRIQPHALQFGGVHWQGGVFGELVFDVDMDDYDRRAVCECPSGRVCSTCWHVYMEPARVALDWILREWFQFRKLLHVFSGRRGFHVWVFDRRAVLLTAEQRKSLVDRVMSAHLVEDELCAHLRELLEPLARKRNMLDWRALFPKLDGPVSRDASHLKKIPLTIHQDTQRIGIPLSRGAEFDPALDMWRPQDVPAETLMEHWCDLVQKVLDLPE